MMHKITIPQSITDRIIARRGRAHILLTISILRRPR